MEIKCNVESTEQEHTQQVYYTLIPQPAEDTIVQVELKWPLSQCSSLYRHINVSMIDTFITLTVQSASAALQHPCNRVTQISTILIIMIIPTGAN